MRGIDPAAVAADPSPAILSSLGVSPIKSPEIRSALRVADPSVTARVLASCGARVIAWGTPEYPPLLMQLAHPPGILYVRGSLDNERTHVAVVGSRTPSAEARANARTVAGDLAKGGAVVVSGGAFGIDTVAHEAALDAGGVTVCVTGTGADVDYPPKHAALFCRIVESRGAVVSVFPLGTPGLPRQFPIRNEVVVGLSRGAVIVEAREKSGTLITARLALDFCRDVFALPGDMARESCHGSNLLLRDGHAKCALGADDVLAEWGLARPVGETAPDGGPTEPTQAAAYAAVRDRPRDADDLSADLGFPIEELAGVLARLEAVGWV